jgi:hypothetical protein
MLTWYAIEIIVKDRILEERKEMMTRLALREAFRDQGTWIFLFRRLWCHIDNFLDGIRFPKEISFTPTILPVKNNPCGDMK